MEKSMENKSIEEVTDWGAILWLVKKAGDNWENQ